MFLSQSNNSVQFLQAIVAGVQGSRTIRDQLEPRPILGDCFDVCGKGLEYGGD